MTAPDPSTPLSEQEMADILAYAATGRNLPEQLLRAVCQIQALTLDVKAANEDANRLAGKLNAAQQENERLKIIDEAFDLSMHRAKHIMKLVRTISSEADAIFCSENDIQHVRKLPPRGDA